MVDSQDRFMDMEQKPLDRVKTKESYCMIVTRSLES